MRVHSLVFVASSALLARGDGVLEPVDSNVAGPFSSSVARSLTENDHENVPVTIPSESESPVNEGERIVTGFSSWIGKVQEKVQTAAQGEKQKIFDSLATPVAASDSGTGIANALKTKKWKGLSARYKRSGESMITPLLDRFGYLKVARALSPALKFNDAGVLQLHKKSASVEEKLAVDMLKHWRDQKSPIGTVFSDLELNVAEGHETLVFRNFFDDERVKVLKAYRQYAKIDDRDYLDAVKTVFGGEKGFLDMLRKALRLVGTAGVAKELETIALRTCSSNPLDVLQKLKSGSLPEYIFDGFTYGLVRKYVAAINKANPAEKTSEFKLITDSLGGKADFLRALVNYKVETEGWLSCKLALFTKWAAEDKVTPTSGLQDRLKGLSSNDRKTITRMYTRFQTFENRKRTDEKGK
uniref:RxLR effector candidate protein n=1 Tax=Peronospora matthiolae TaxID=2874970 RepID=A0AAV1TYL2_9STRA